MDEYKKQLQEQYDWYMNHIDEIHKSNHWNFVPTDAFYFKLVTGKVTEKRDDIEWLEYAIPKMQAVLAKIEEHIEREQFKKLMGVDQMNKLRKI